ncbi:hypothetical protein [Chitinophaga sp.]|uniref:hypothetical protein n=1 Tax=Chitinophaga sp. TaxID=1869181 RepID=UPI0031DB0E4B
MPVATTYFIKAQIPGVTLDQLLTLYGREIRLGGADEAYIEDNMVRFSGAAFRVGRHRGKFADFTDGRLIIEETPTEYLVSLEASWPKTIPLFSVFFTNLRNKLEQEIWGLR